MKKSFTIFLISALGAIFVLGSFIQCHISSNNKESIEFLKQRLSFKEFLKSKGVSIDAVPSNFETVQSDNKYSNNYFCISTEFPEGWELDRGNGPVSVVRAANRLTGSTIALLVTPLKLKDLDSYKKFQKNPLQVLDDGKPGSFQKSMQKNLGPTTNLDISGLKVFEEKVRSTNYAVTEYIHKEHYKDGDVEYKTTSYSTILWDLNINFSYSAPKDFYDQDFINHTILYANFLNPENCILEKKGH
jgi:hypothetical protein